LPKSIAIIGAGPLGRWLAQAAARAGYRVVLEDVVPEALRRARDQLEQHIDIPGLRVETWGNHADIPNPNSRISNPSTKNLSMGTPGTWGTTPDTPDPQSGSIRFASTIEDAVREADLAIDCVPDELESKLEIFCLLDRMAPPRTVLMTPTTRLSIADLASCTYRAERCVAIADEAAGLTEGARRELTIRATAKTAAETAELVREFWERLGFAVRMECEM
jgi:3-hydroxybutyryl-CoA dehydrogenase